MKCPQCQHLDVRNVSKCLGCDDCLVYSFECDGIIILIQTCNKCDGNGIHVFPCSGCGYPNNPHIKSASKLK